jgi:hypothetical protein
MRVGSSPQAEHDSLLVALRRVMGEGDVQLKLDPRVVREVTLRVAEQWLVAGVFGEVVGQGMTRSEVDASGDFVKPSFAAESVKVGQLLGTTRESSSRPRAPGSGLVRGLPRRGSSGRR